MCLHGHISRKNQIDSNFGSRWLSFEFASTRGKFEESRGTPRFDSRAQPSKSPLHEAISRKSRKARNASNAREVIRNLPYTGKFLRKFASEFLKIKNRKAVFEFQNSEIGIFEISVNWSRIGVAMVLNFASFVQLSNFSKIEISNFK